MFKGLSFGHALTMQVMFIFSQNGGHNTLVIYSELLLKKYQLTIYKNGHSKSLEMVCLTNLYSFGHYY